MALDRALFSSEGVMCKGDQRFKLSCQQCQGIGCARALINLPLTYGQTSFSRKLFLQHTECSALMETEIKKGGNRERRMEIQSTCGGEDSSKLFFFFFEIRNRMCRTFGTAYIPLITKMS